MGDVGAHSQCIIVGDFLLNTVDKLREELVVNKEITSVLEDVSIETKRRQVIEYLVTLYFKYRSSKPSFYQSKHIVTCYDVKFYPESGNSSTSGEIQGAADTGQSAANSGQLATDTGQTTENPIYFNSDNEETDATSTTSILTDVTPTKKKRGRPKKSVQQSEKGDGSPQNAVNTAATTPSRSQTRKRVFRSEAVIREEKLQHQDTTTASDVRQGREPEPASKKRTKLELKVSAAKNSTDSTDGRNRDNLFPASKTLSPRVRLVKLPADLWSDRKSGNKETNKIKIHEETNVSFEETANGDSLTDPDYSNDICSSSNVKETLYDTEAKLAVGNVSIKRSKKIRTSPLNVKKSAKKQSDSHKSVTKAKVGRPKKELAGKSKLKNNLQSIGLEGKTSDSVNTNECDINILGNENITVGSIDSNVISLTDLAIPSIHLAVPSKETAVVSSENSNEKQILEMNERNTKMDSAITGDQSVNNTCSEANQDNKANHVFNEDNGFTEYVEDDSTFLPDLTSISIQDKISPLVEKQSCKTIKNSLENDAPVASNDETDLNSCPVEDALLATLIETKEENVKVTSIKNAHMPTQNESESSDAKSGSTKDARMAKQRSASVQGRRGGGRKVSLEVKEDDPDNYVKVAEVTPDMKITDLYFKIANKPKLELVCRVCGYHAGDTARMKVHLRVHTGSKVKVQPVSIDNSNKYGCPHDNCSYQNDNKTTVVRHYYSVHRKLLPCSQCDKKFSYRCELRKHLLTAHSNTPCYVCSTCGKGYKSHCGLLQHQRVSHPQASNMYMCHICDKQLSSRTRLQDHLASAHMQKLLHRCQHCKKQFRWATSLKRHVESSHNNKTVSCQLCDATFTSNSALKDHKAHFHNESSRCLACVHCGNSYKWARSLKRHIAKRHPKEDNILFF